MFKTNLTTQLARYLLFSLIAKDVKVSGGGNNYENKTVKKLLCFKNSNGARDYLIPKAKQAFT